MTENNIAEYKEQLLNYGMNRFKVDEWYDLLHSTDFDMVEYDKLLLYFACNIENHDGYASKQAFSVFLSKIEDAIYERVKDERLGGKFDVFTSVGFSTLIQSITNATSMDQKVINMFFALILTEIVKVGVNAWCKYYESKRGNTGG